MININQIIKEMDLEGNPSDHRVVVAMSGGVDSSVTAALLVEAGFEVVGLTMQLYDYGRALQKKGACCAGSDINDARLVSSKLGIPHYVLNYESIFQDQVMNDFADSYLKGETPIPFVRFPLGSLTKAETRSVAKRHELNVADKPDSQDICFVPEGKYADVVRRLRPGRIDKGDIIDLNGNVIGKHNGIIDFTIGQRKGIGIGGRKGVDDSNSILYVIALDTKKNHVIVGPKEFLSCNKIKISECNWIIDLPQKSKFKVLVKLRNSSEPVLGTIKANFDTSFVFLYFDEPQFGVSTGQAAVFYNVKDRSHVLGGGWITEAPNKLPDNNINNA